MNRLEYITKRVAYLQRVIYKDDILAAYDHAVRDYDRINGGGIVYEFDRYY